MLAPLLRFELRHQLLPDHRITHRALLTFFAQAARRAKSPSLMIPINSPCPSTTGRALIRFLNKMLETCRTEASGLNRNHIHDHDVPGFHTPRPCSSISTKSQRKSPPAHTPFSFSIKLDGTAPKTSRLPKTSRSCRCRRVRRSSTPRKHLAVHAGELAVEPHLQILRRNRRHCCYAWNTLIDQPWKIMSIARRDWAVAGHSM